MTTPSNTLSRRAFLHGACALGAGLGLAGTTAGLLPLNAVASSGLRTEQQTRLLMGTMVTLTAASPDPARAEAAFQAAFAEMKRLTTVFDRHDSASAISALNSAGSLSGAPLELLGVVNEGLRLGRSTDSAFNPAVTPVLDLYENPSAIGGASGFDKGALAEALALADPSAVRVDKKGIRLERGGMRLTLDGIAKGFVADAASRVLSDHGLPDHMVNAGGDIRVSGLAADRRPWRIGIQHPEKRGALLASLPMKQGGIATSGNYEHAFNRSRSSNHLINHHTGRCSEAASVTVKAENAMRADALATALAVMPPTLAVAYVEKHAPAACFIVDRYGRRYVSASWG